MAGFQPGLATCKANTLPAPVPNTILYMKDASEAPKAEILRGHIRIVLNLEITMGRWVHCSLGGGSTP